MDGEIIVALNCRAVFMPRRAAIPATVGVLMPSQPVESALDSLFTGGAGAAALGQGRTIRIESGAVEAWNLGQVATAGRPRQVSQRRARTRSIVPPGMARTSGIGRAGLVAAGP